MRDNRWGRCLRCRLYFYRLIHGLCEHCQEALDNRDRELALIDNRDRALALLCSVALVSAIGAMIWDMVT